MIEAKEAWERTTKILNERNSNKLAKEKYVFNGFLDWLDIKIKESLDSGYSMSFYLREYLSYVDAEDKGLNSLPSWTKTALENMNYTVNTSKYQGNDECISISWENSYKVT
jgi:hypothetical protein